MSTIPARTPRTTTKAIVKRGGVAKAKHTELYAKQIRFTFAGANPKQLEEVAHACHLAIAKHSAVIGGKAQRKVTVTHESGMPFKIFDGTILPDGI